MSHPPGLLLRFKTLLGLRPVSDRARRFTEDAREYRDRVTAQRERLRVASGGRRTAFLVTPWMRTAVPFFSVETAFLAAARGLQPILVWDAADVVHNAGSPHETEALRAIVEALRGVVEVREPGEEDPTAQPPEALLFENFVRSSRGERQAHAKLAADSEVVAVFQRHYRRIFRLLAEMHPDHLVIPGGLWGLSGLYLHAAQKLGIPVTTYDSGTGLLAMDHSGITAHYGDIATAWRKYRPVVLADAALRERVWQSARESLDRRMHGRDHFQLQTQTPDAATAPPCDVLIPLNFRMDSAAMLRNRIFRNVEEWLVGILAWLEARPGVTAVIRQHPCERMERYRGSDDWSELVAARPALAGRVCYVSANDPVNTYSLLEKCRVVVPYTSRLGAEAGLLGIPAVVATTSYYSESDFVFRAEDRMAFEQLLDAAVEGRLQLSDDQRCSAALVYALIENCTLLRTPFTPAIENFRKWVKVPVEEFEQLDGVADFADALFTRTPVPGLLFERTFQPEPTDA